MKGTLKLIRRFLMMVICIAPILLLLNLILLAVLTWKDRSHNGGWTAAREIGEALTPVEGGGYLLSGEGREILEQYNAWGILVEDGTGNVVWHSDPVVVLVIIFDAQKHLHRVPDRGLGYGDGLEAAFQRRVLLNIFPVLCKGGGPNGLYLPTGQGGL